MNMAKEIYDTHPMFYCSQCCSPAVILDEVEELYVCKDCGGTAFIKASVEVWQEEFGNMWGKDYLCIPNKEFKKIVSWA